VDKKINDNPRGHSGKTIQGIKKKHIDELNNIINQLDKTFSQMKIFSSDHENVESFIDLLYDRISKYLQDNWKIEIGIEEFSFTFKGIPFYTEKQLSKSLPFLFYKDGVKMLFIYKGLSRDELKQFLEIMKRTISLPPEESDIVISLWEKDFANIRYFAPDDYLETKIGIGMEILEYEVDKNKLFTGKISLKPEDKSALKRKEQIINKDLKKKFEKFMGAEKYLLSKREKRSLTDMIQDHRKESEEKQFKTLLLDILYLEKRNEKIQSLINQSAQYVGQQINKGNFQIAFSIYMDVLELKNYFSEIDPSKEKLVQNFFNSPEIKITLSQAEELLEKKSIEEFDPFLKYLSLMGSKSIPILSYLYDHIEKSEQTNKIIEALRKVGKENFSELVSIARDERPGLTLKIISILGDSKEKIAINHLASFLSFKNKKVLHAAIKAIGDFKDPNANKILFSLLSNPDPEIRILATQNIHLTENDPVFDKILHIIKEKKFKKESKTQKQALLWTLARSYSKKAFRVLENIIKKIGFFSGPSKVETGICAVNALKKTGEPSAYHIIKNMTQSRNRKIKKKCREIEKEFFQQIKHGNSHE